MSFDVHKESLDLRPLLSSSPAVDAITIEERQLLGRYGIWLLVGLCAPTPDTPVETLGRLLSMLFHWFHVTAYTIEGIIKQFNNNKFYMNSFDTQRAGCFFFIYICVPIIFLDIT